MNTIPLINIFTTKMTNAAKIDFGESENSPVLNHHKAISETIDGIPNPTEKKQIKSFCSHTDSPAPAITIAKPANRKGKRI